MKKELAIMLAAACVLSLSACGKKDEAPETTTAPETFFSPETTEMVFETETEINWDLEETEIDWELDFGEDTQATTQETVPQLELPDKMKRLETAEVVYATQNVNIRMKPTVNSNSPGKLKRGESADRIATSTDGWSAVMIDNELRYIASKYLTTKAPQEGGSSSGGSANVTETPASGTIYTKQKVNLRKGPGTDTPILDTMPGGATLSQLAVCSNGWIKVNYNGTVGYVAGGYLTTEPPKDATVPTTPPATTEPTTESTAADETTKATTGTEESTQATQATSATEATQATKATEASQATENTKATEASQATEETQATKAADASEESTAA